MAENGERIKELEGLITLHQKLYYNAQPAISDEEFDILWSELEDLDPSNPLLAVIGRDRVDGWPKAEHLIPMGSQSKATDSDEFTAWALKNPFSPYIVQYKLDGASIELQYREGLLEKAVTRGDGKVGDEITANVRKMRGAIPKLSESFTGGVRGEVLMSRAIHAASYSDKANCRNAANGLMKRKDGEGSGDLDIICYDARGFITIQGKQVSPFTDELGKLEWLKSGGFTVVRTELFQDVASIVEYRAKVMALRPSLAYDIDGLVVKGGEIDEEDLAKPRPEKQIAFKFSPEEAVTTLLAVEWSESGSLYTPIGVVEPVRLAGTTVQRANLCNPDMIRSMDLRIGSHVVITKRGEIIPKIEVLVDNPANSGLIMQPLVCGSCGAFLVDEGSRLFCPNELCPKKELHRIEKWLTILDVRGFGTALAGRLFASGKVRTVADLYRLDAASLEFMERMGPVLARKLLRNLRKTEELDLAEFIAAFDIEGVGLLVAEKLVRSGFDSLGKLLAAREEELVTIDGIAETMAGTIVGGLAAVRDEMREVVDLGFVLIKAPARPEGPTGALAGMSFCFTGELTSIKRAEAEKRVRALGGTAKGAVTADLNFLVTNEPGSGSSKNKKAREYGVKILSESEFLSILGGRG
ncbi:MAG: NAD-dependent DNA ligase LigA [Spirochaetes bacterium]|nr:NAD-dependent DNA ligase LigA [Spirochaetota bacterium]